MLFSYLADLPEEQASPKKRKKSPSGPSLEALREFAERVGRAEESRHESMGLGEDYRYEGDALTGSMLTHEGACVWASFRVPEVETRQKTTGGRRSSLADDLDYCP